MARMELLRCKKMDMVLSLIITISLALPFTGSCSSHGYSRSDFPEGFAFGSGASSYQVRYFGSAFFFFFSVQLVTLYSDSAVVRIENSTVI